MKLKHLITNVQNLTTYFFYLRLMSESCFDKKWNHLRERWNQRRLRIEDPADWVPDLDASTLRRRRSKTPPFMDDAIWGRCYSRTLRSPLTLFKVAVVRRWYALRRNYFENQACCCMYLIKNDPTKVLRNTLVRRLTLITHSPLICTPCLRSDFEGGRKVVLQTYLHTCKTFGHNPLVSCDFGPNSKPRICKVHVPGGRVSRGVVVKTTTYKFLSSFEC